MLPRSAIVRPSWSMSLSPGMRGLRPNFQQRRQYMQLTWGWPKGLESCAPGALTAKLMATLRHKRHCPSAATSQPLCSKPFILPCASLAKLVLRPGGKAAPCPCFCQGSVARARGAGDANQWVCICEGPHLRHLPSISARIAPKLQMSTAGPYSLAPYNSSGDRYLHVHETQQTWWACQLGWLVPSCAWNTANLVSMSAWVTGTFMCMKHSKPGEHVSSGDW